MWCVIQGEFSTYLLQQYKAKKETERRSKQVAFHLPAIMSNSGNAVPIVNIHSTHDGAVLTVKENGFICQWSPELKPQRTKHMFVCIVCWLNVKYFIY